MAHNKVADIGEVGKLSSIPTLEDVLMVSRALRRFLSTLLYGWGFKRFLSTLLCGWWFKALLVNSSIWVVV